MSDKIRIIHLQKQLAIAVRALKDIRDNGISWTVAQSALDDIEQIQVKKIGGKP